MNLAKANAIIAEHGDKPFRRLPLDVKPLVKAARMVVSVAEANAAERAAACTEADVERARKAAAIRADILRPILEALPPEVKPAPAPKPRPPAPTPKSKEG